MAGHLSLLREQERKNIKKQEVKLSRGWPTVLPHERLSMNY